MERRRTKALKLSGDWRILACTQIDPADTQRPEALVNISGGRISFTIDRPFEPKKFVSLKVQRTDSRPLLLFGEVISCEQKGHDEQYVIIAELWWEGWADLKEQKKIAAYISQTLQQ